jgi:hypothetical protein
MTDTAERMTPERLAEIRGLIAIESRMWVTHPLRELLAELDAVTAERDEWKAKYEATATAWEESKQHREHDRKERQELLAALALRGVEGE